MNKTKQSGDIPVLFCSNRQYCEHMAVAIASLLTNNPGHRFRIYVALTESACEERSRIQETVARFSNAILVFKLYDPAAIKDFPIHSHITVDSYVRLFFSEMVDPDVDRLLYLDCDLIVCSDIEPLWKCDMQGAILGAVPDAFSDNHRALGFAEDETYFNSGVLLIDARRWRAADLTPALVKYILENGPKLRYLDQDVLNAVLRGGIYPLPLRWNFTPRHADSTPELLGLSRREFMEIRRKPGIVHFASGFKPWYYGFEPHYKDRYYRYRALTPWRRQAAKPKPGEKPALGHALKERAKAMLKWYFPWVASRLRRSTGMGDPVLQRQFVEKRSASG